MRGKRNGTGVCLLVLALATAGCNRQPGDIPPVTAPPAASHANDSSPASPAPEPETVARLEFVRRSLEQGLDVNKADAYGRTPLMMASFDGYTEVTALLLEHGAEVNQVDATGRTALMYAASGPFPETVELLLKNGATVNAADTAEGFTALMFAAAEGHLPVVEILLSNGADAGILDVDGDAAIDHAREREQSSIIALLQDSPNP